jgi:Ca-activated chloride channel family protein
VEAIVNSTDRHLSNQGTISRAIHQVAGAELLQACLKLNECAEGEAKITPGFQLPAKWVIHTVCPAWRGGKHREEELLAQCYRSCLELAAAQGIRSLAFPALGTGGLGFPVKRAAQIAVKTVGSFLLNSTAIGIVRFVCFDEKTLQHYKAECDRMISL